MKEVAGILELQRKWADIMKAQNTLANVIKMENFQNELARRILPALDFRNQVEHKSIGDNWQKFVAAVVGNNKSIHHAFEGIYQKVGRQGAMLDGISKAIVGDVRIPKQMANFSSMAVKMFDTWNTTKALSPLAKIAKDFEQYKPLDYSVTVSGLRGLDHTVLIELMSQVSTATKIAEKALEQSLDVSTEIENLKQFVEQSQDAILEQIRKSDKSPKAVIAFWLGIISFLYSIIYPFCQPKSATYEQIEAIEKDQKDFRNQFDEFKEFLKKRFEDSISEISELKIVARTTVLRLKPKNKSLFLQTLTCGDSVNIVAVKHQWVYISIIGDEGDIVHGWMLKKYLK